MKCHIVCAIIVLVFSHATQQEEVRLLDLDPQDAQQIIEQQDTSLKYAPKVESNVPAVRYLGNEPHNVAEDIYLANQYHGQDGLGGYLYGYSVPDIAKTEKKKAGGDLRGAYNYIAGNGQEIKVEYWDDGTGFHQIDNVPKNLPEDLPEVKKAKEDFMRIWQEQAERNSRPVEDPYNSEGQYKEGPLSVQGQLHRQQQFTAQFGQNPGYQQPGGYQSAASQQRPVYESNLEKTQQTYNPNYQPYQGRDQQNQGTYQSKQYSSSSAQGNQGNQGKFQGNQGQYQPHQDNQPQYQPGQANTGYGKSATGGGTPGYGQGNVGGGYGQGISAQGPKIAQGYGNPNPATHDQKNQGQWNQPTQKTSYQGHQGGFQSQYQGQPSQNVNQYAPQPQNAAYGNPKHGGHYSGQESQNQNKYNSQQNQEDDGEYHEKDEEQGPPKGFFYKFDYPVGIIVSKQGPAQGGQHSGGYPQEQQPNRY
ncbi:hypothetical protein HHI36_005483 [Cryptolaemus montrouzieri]|uniref:Uncharacterized protein n=1 Tax=Cryptolaemus montrouzieri TaxID=559131 RepID=A0ABD2NUW5_9CUCU